MPYNLENLVSKRARIYRQMSQYYNYCEQIRQMSPTTVRSKIYILNNFISVTKLSDLRKITNQDINNWIKAQFRRGNTGRSINDRLAHLRAMLHWQQDMNLPMPHLRLGLIVNVKEAPARKVCFSRAEIQQVLDVSDPQEWLMIKLAFDCGLRISELQKLNLSHISGNKITIIGKGNKKRYAFMSPEVSQRLREWIAINDITAYLWPSPINLHEPLATCTMRDKMRLAFARAGFDDFCPHDLRHSYATDLKQIGIPTRQIQAGLGHSSEATTERYLSDLDGLDLYKIYQAKYSQR